MRESILKNLHELDIFQSNSYLTNNLFTTLSMLCLNREIIKSYQNDLQIAQNKILLNFQSETKHLQQIKQNSIINNRSFIKINIIFYTLPNIDHKTSTIQTVNAKLNTLTSPKIYLLPAYLIETENKTLELACYKEDYHFFQLLVDNQKTNSFIYNIYSIYCAISAEKIYEFILFPTTNQQTSFHLQSIFNKLHPEYFKQHLNNSLPKSLHFIRTLKI